MSDVILSFKNFSAWWGHQQVLGSVNLDVKKNDICAIIGPSGAGKSTLLRSINRLNEKITSWRTEGEILLKNVGSLSTVTDVELRRHVGMVFQKPVIFPRSVYENVLFGLKYTGRGNKKLYSDIAEHALRTVHLWEEVKDRLKKPARQLSLGQQQRLCLARTLAVEPEILLLDEPTASLDPKSTRAVEETLIELKSRFTIVVVTHNLSQARRIANQAAFLWTDHCCGKLVECGEASQVFDFPKEKLTASYINEAD